MIQLFKAKSLKSNTKTGDVANNRNAKKQRGRSMVEMLGVLAIIGVLSIGGIQGYTLAMRKYRANEILNLVNKYGLLVYANCQTAMEKDPERNYIIDHERHGGYGENFWRCLNKINFTDAGLGPVPTGVYSIGGDSSTLEAAGSHVAILSRSSGDVIFVLVEFETKELCETVMNITGKPETDTAAYGMIGPEGDQTCGANNSTYYYLYITIMAN